MNISADDKDVFPNPGDREYYLALRKKYYPDPPPQRYFSNHKQGKFKRKPRYEKNNYRSFD